MTEETNNASANDASAAAAPAADTAKPDTAAAGNAKAPDKAPAAEGTPAAQQIPLDRFQAVIAQRAEIQRANEALTRELKLANDTIEEFKALSAKGTTAGDAKPNGAAKGPSAAELQQLVNEEASRQNFNQRCNDAAVAGRAAHSDFDKVVLGDLTNVSPVLDSRTGRPVLPVPLLEAALETGNAPEVLYELGKDIVEASRIMGLRPVAQAVELAKFSAKMAEKKSAAAAADVDEEGKPVLPNVSKAPAPIKAPTKGGPVKPAFTEFDTDNFSTEEWIRQREKKIADARAARR